MNTQATRAKGLLRYGLFISAPVFVLDQISKLVVLEFGRFSPPGCLETGFGCRFIELSPFFDLRMVWNRGVSFGLLRADTDIVRWGLVGLSFAIAAVFLSWLRTADRKLTGVALALVIGGALGNVVDRIRFGAVVDFLDFNGLWFPWVFNVADAAITVGAVLLAADMLLFTETEAGRGSPWGKIKARASAVLAKFGGAEGGPKQ